MRNSKNELINNHIQLIEQFWKGRSVKTAHFEKTTGGEKERNTGESFTLEK